jgi:hypothetical protein
MLVNEDTVNEGVDVYSGTGKKTVVTLPHGIIVQECLMVYFTSHSTSSEVSCCMYA